MKTFKELREASDVSSSHAQHMLSNDAERRAHSALMQKKHGVRTTYHGSDELKYHGPKKNVKKALGTHYGGDHSQAKDDHPHIYKENVKTADRKPEIYTKPDGKKGTRMVPVDREVIKQEKNLEWLKAALAKEAAQTKPRQDDMEEDVQELTIADVQKATAMAKKRQAKEREAGKKSVSTTDLAARLPKKEATIPDGQTAMTKTPAMKDKDKKTMGKIADLMKRANESNVDEISKGMASRYIKKAQVSTADAAKSTERGYTDSRSPDRDIAKAGKAQTRKGIKTFINRNKGTSTAVDKLTGKAKVPAKEGMNELSMSMKDLTKTGLNKAASPDKDKIRKGLDALKKAGNKKADAEAGERRKKMSELSNNKMGQYVRKAADDAAKKGAAGDTKKAQARVKGVSKAMDKIDHNRLFGRQG